MPLLLFRLDFWENLDENSVSIKRVTRTYRTAFIVRPGISILIWQNINSPSFPPQINIYELSNGRVHAIRASALMYYIVFTCMNFPKSINKLRPRPSSRWEGKNYGKLKEKIGNEYFPVAECVRRETGEKTK